MKIELKNIKHSPSLSEETEAFTASLYIDGKKVGNCTNRGHGGCTDIDAIYHDGNKDEQITNREIIKKANEYCKTLPPITNEFGGNPLSMDLEFYVDLELSKHLKQKDIAKCLKKLDRECIKKIVVVSKKVLEGYKENKNDLTWSQLGYKIPLVEVHRINPEAFKAQIAKTTSELKGDEYIYNTNLPD